MEDKEAMNILINLPKKYSLYGKEKEAVSTAIGILSWSTLAKGRMKGIAKAQKAKRDKSVEWK